MRASSFNDCRTPPRKRPPQVVVDAAASDKNSNASDQPLSTPANEVVTPTTKARLQEADDNRRKEKQLVDVVSNLTRNGRREELVKRLGEKDELIDSDELSVFLDNLKGQATESVTMKSLESALRIPGSRAALLDVASALGAPPAERKRYVPGRKIDRREIVHKIFNGEELGHEDMFSTRGYRGLNVLPFPKHIKKQIDEGFIKLSDTRKFCSKNGRIDYTNYERVNEQPGDESGLSDDLSSDSELLSPVNPKAFAMDSKSFK